MTADLIRSSSISSTLSVSAAQALTAAAVAVAADIRAHADELRANPVGRRRLSVLGLVPSITFSQSRFWRYQLTECAARLSYILTPGATCPRILFRTKMC